MSDQESGKASEQGMSKLKLALGAASLFLFIIGVKRTFHMEQPETGKDGSGGDRKRPPEEKRKQRQKQKQKKRLSR